MASTYKDSAGVERPTQWERAHVGQRINLIRFSFEGSGSMLDDPLPVPSARAERERIRRWMQGRRDRPWSTLTPGSPDPIKNWGQVTPSGGDI